MTPLCRRTAAHRRSLRGAAKGFGIAALAALLGLGAPVAALAAGAPSPGCAEINAGDPGLDVTNVTVPASGATFRSQATTFGVGDAIVWRYSYSSGSSGVNPGNVNVSLTYDVNGASPTILYADADATLGEMVPELRLTSSGPNAQIRVRIVPLGGHSVKLTSDVICVPSSVATLTGLTVSQGTLGNFQQTSYSYSLAVGASVSSFTLTPTLANPLATLTVNGVAATSGAPFSQGLNPGVNIVDVAVTAEDGSQNVYVLTVTRNPQGQPTMALTASPQTVNSGACVTLNASLSGGSAPYAGTVAFSDGASALGAPVPVSSAGVATTQACSLATGSHTISATYTSSNADNQSGASHSVAVNVIAAAKGAPTVALVASTQATVPGKPVTFTATLSGGASPTGTVTFLDNGAVLGTSPLSQGVAVLTSAALTPGANPVVASYSGDSQNLGASSNTVLVNTRPDPSVNPTVIGIVDAQAQAAVRFGQAQIDNVFGRLEQLHDEALFGAGEASPSAPGAKAVLPPGGAAGLGALAPAFPGNSATGGDGSLGSLFPGLGAGAPGAARGVARIDDSTRALQTMQSALPEGVAALDRAMDLPFHVWTAGGLSFGALNAEGVVDNRYTTSGVTLGLDRRVADSLVLGAAVGFGLDHDAIGTDGTQVASRALTLTLYESWSFAPHSYLDVHGGFGSLAFAASRWDDNVHALLTGKRGGTDLYGSVSITHDARYGVWNFAPYARIDAVEAQLRAYAEDGPLPWALSYDAMRMNALNGVVGARLGYAVTAYWGELTPTARLEYRHAFASGATQGLNYSDLVNVSPGYLISGSSQSRDAVTGGLGLRGNVAALGEFDCEFDVTSSQRGFESEAVTLKLSKGF